MASLLTLEGGHRLKLFGRTATELLGATRPGSTMTARVVDLAPGTAGGDARPLHFHDGVGEFIWVLAGSGNLVSSAGNLPVTADQGIFVPPGESHKLVADEGVPLRLLCVFSSPDIGAVTRE